MVDSFPHSMLVFDIERFGRRTDVDQQWLRANLRDILARVLEESGVPRQGLGWQDTGDGGFFLVPATVPKRVLIDPLVPRLNAALREHNNRASEQGRLRLRVALHAGDVASDTGVDGRAGYVGRDLNTACRLVDSAPVREALAGHADAQLALIVSDGVYRSAVCRGDGTIDPAGYRPARITIKEVDETAWVHVPGTVAGQPSGPAADHLPDPAGSPAEPASPADTRAPAPAEPAPPGRRSAVAAGREPAATGGIHLYGAVSAGNDVNVGDRTEYHHYHGGGDGR